MYNMKKLIHSKTFQVAVLQGLAGIVVVALTELDMVGYVAMVKSLADVALRLVTSETVVV
jgi:hypothetical protein